MKRKAPLNIVIVGAGLGGCAAAFCFSRLGHHVQVFEQRDALTPQGGGIMIRPGASRFLQAWGLGPTFAAISDESPATLIRDIATGKIVTRNVAVESSAYPDWGITREVTIRVFYDKAVQAGARFHFNSNVEAIREDDGKVSVDLTGADTVTADLLLAADGIRSRLRPMILADVETPVEPRVSKITLYQISNSFEELNKDPIARKLCENVNLTVWMGGNKFVVGRSGQKVGKYGLLFGLQEDTNQKGLWDEDGDIEYVREAFSGSDLALRAALQISSKCDRWKLAEMPDLERWTSKHGRMILLGDSAHGMLPNAAQGFSQIVEDIAALEYLLQERADLPVLKATDVWQRVRKPRVERIKGFAAWNTYVFLGEETVRPSMSVSVAQKVDGTPNQEQSGHVKSLKGMEGDRDAPYWTSVFLKWAHDYDAVDEVKKFLATSQPKL